MLVPFFLPQDIVYENIKEQQRRQRNADSQQRWYGRQIKLSGDRSVYADRAEIISKVSQLNNRKGGGCNITEILTGLAAWDKWISEVSACFWQTLRSHSLSRNVTNNPNTVKARSATGISHSYIFQPSVHGRRKKEQIIFQGMWQKADRNPWWNSIWNAREDQMSLMLGLLPIPWPSSVRLLVRGANGSLRNCSHLHVQCVSGGTFERHDSVAEIQPNELYSSQRTLNGIQSIAHGNSSKSFLNCNFSHNTFSLWSLSFTAFPLPKEAH